MRSASRISVLSFGWVKGRRKLSLGVLLPALILAGASCFQALAQQPTSNAPIYQVNSQYLQGRTWADYKASAGAALTLNVAAGTVWCDGTLVTYAGGTLTMTNAATNYVYLDTTSSCVPASSTGAFPSTGIPLATVVAAGGAITTVTDNRSLLTAGGGGGGGGAGAEYNIKDYGAVCDGATSDVVAFQAALDAAGAKGGVIYIPPSATKCVWDADLSLPVNGAGRRNGEVGAIRFIFDGGVKITSKVDWLDSQVTIQGRAGGAHPWGGSSSNAEIECALDAATSCIENTKDAVYALNFENLTFSGVVKNYLDLGDIDGCHLTNIVTSPDVARESVVLRGGIWVWIKDGALFGNGPTYGAIGLYGRGIDNWLPAQIYLDGTILSYGGIHAYSDDQAAGNGELTQIVINNVTSENLSDQFFVASGGKTMYIEAVTFNHVNMADNAVPAELMKFTGGALPRSINVHTSCDTASPHQINAPGSNSVGGLNISGACAGVYVVPGPNDGFSQIDGRQNQLSSLFLGKWNAYTYHPPLLQIEPDSNNRETLVIRPYNNPSYHYPDTFRLEDPDTLQNYFTLEARGKMSSAEIGGSIKLNALGTPSVDTITPTGLDQSKTWGYKVVGLDRLGGHTAASAEKTTTHGATTLGTNDYNTVDYACLSTAYQIQIWRTTSGGTPATTGLIGTVPGSVYGASANGLCHYADHGAAGDGNPEPSTNTTGVAILPTVQTTNPIESTYGGTGNGFTKFTGPTSAEKTFTLPDASATILTSNAAVTIAQGGTGQTAQTAAFDALAPTTTRGDLIYRGASNNLRLGVGTNGQCVTSNGTDPVWGSCSSGSSHNLLSATHSDTTAGTVVRGDIITGQGASPTWTRLAKGTANQVLSMDGTATDVAWVTPLQLIGSGTSGNGPVKVGTAATAARSDHDHRSIHELSWFFPGTPATGVQNMTLVFPEVAVDFSILDMRVTVATMSASSSTFNIQRCTANCTSGSVTFSDIYSTVLTLSANNRTVTKSSAPNQNVASLTAGDQFRANLVTIGASLADVTVTMTVKYDTTN
jgi:hypothetical protein